MFAAFISGIATALTPCTIVIIPVFLYRFGIWGDRNKKVMFKELFLSIFGFLISLVSFGLLFDYISNLEIFNALRLILGTLFIVIGVLELSNKLNLNFITNTSNSFVLGLIFPWVLSFSPCVLPIFSAFFSTQISTGQIYLKLLFWGFGVLTPAVLMSLVGNKLFEIFKKGGKAFYFVEKFSGIIIIVSGLYLNFQLLDMKSLDIILASGIFLLIILSAGFFVFIKERRINLANILMFVSIIVLWGAFTFNCYNEARHKQAIESINKTFQLNQYSCGAENQECSQCKRCATLFSIAAILGATGYVISKKRK